MHKIKVGVCFSYPLVFNSSYVQMTVHPSL